MNYRREHHELQAILAWELQDYGPHPLEPRDADAVAWHLADVTLQVVADAVERELERAKAEDEGAKRIADINARLTASEKPTVKGPRWWRRGTS